MFPGRRIKELREEKRVLQRHLAGKLDMDTPMYSKIERGERKAKREQIIKLAMLLDANENEGFKSIKTTELELKPINVFIGSNGSGKSNFIAFFKLVNAVFNKQLQRFVIREKADNLLYFGRMQTQSLFGKMIFATDGEENNAYLFELNQTNEGGLFIHREASGYKVSKDDDIKGYNGTYDIEESHIPDSDSRRDKYLRKYLKSLQIYHFQTGRYESGFTRRSYKIRQSRV